MTSLALTDGMLLYHGSYDIVQKIDLQKCRQGKDFGRGFYLTSSYEQAKNFVPLSVKKQINMGTLTEETMGGVISVFELHLNADVNIFTFDSADAEWLHFVTANRRTDLLPDLKSKYENYDIIAGKIANDRTARTLQLYISGGYGEPGSEEADRIAIETLLPNRLENQFCFCNQKAIQTLEFIRGDHYEFGSF